MKLLITGGCGFIGSNFIKHILKDPSVQKVVNVDLLTYAGVRASCDPFEDDPRYFFVHADIADAEAMDVIFLKHEIDVVLNFAAESHVDRSILDPHAFVKTNLVGTSVLLEAVRRRGVERFIQISTDEVYGSLGLNDPSFHEKTLLNPRNPYSSAKAGADLMVLAYNHTFGINTSVTRCSNNYGPNQFPEKLIALTILNALQGKLCTIHGKGTNIRDWIHVEDHCRGIAAVLKCGLPGRVYHFGGDCELQNIEVVRQIIQETGASERLIVHVQDRPGNDLRYSMSFEPSVDELGWYPMIGFKEGLKETIKWYKDNMSWWEPILSGEYLKQNLRKR